jgi:outer membrane protein
MSPITQARTLGPALLLASLATLHTVAQADDEAFPSGIDGEIGLGVYSSGADIKGSSNHASVLPYAYFDYRRLFVRIDTLGVKTARLGDGYLELAGRISRDGYTSNAPVLKAPRHRSDSIPLGLGTLQETPVGDVFANWFHDVGKSGGNLYDLTYAGRIDLAPVTFYPEAGFEYQSASYVRYYYGITAQEAAPGIATAYRPGGSLNPSLGVMAELALPEHWRLNLYLSRKWFGHAVRDSPLANSKTQDSGFLALSYSFE